MFFFFKRKLLCTGFEKNVDFFILLFVRSGNSVEKADFLKRFNDILLID